MKKLIKAGHLVMTFKTGQDAAKAREKLLAARFEEHEVRQWAQVEVLANLQEARSEVMSMEYRPALEKFFALAKQGSGFLDVYAPSESESHRAVDLVRELQFAEKYNRSTMEDIAA